jgi:hypothetical protein
MRYALRVTVTTFGTLAGLAGLEHGIGEILQGNVAPASPIIESWPKSDFFRVLGGEPAVTVVPNLLLSGILTILVSLIFILWATQFVQRKYGGLVMILLSLVMLLVGGGFGPPVLGIVLGTAATRIRAPLTWGSVHLAGRLHTWLGTLWWWAFVTCLAAWLFLMPGLSLLAYFFGLNDSNIVLATVLLAFSSLLLTLVAAFARDSESQSAAFRPATRGAARI